MKPYLFPVQGDYKSQKEAVWVITNLTSGGSVEQIAHVVQCGVLGPLCNLMTAKESKMVQVILDGVDHIIEVGFSCTDIP